MDKIEVFGRVLSQEEIEHVFLKAAILTGFSGGALAVLFQLLLAPDVALTQAIVGAAIVPVFLALAVKKTQRDGS